MEGKSTTSSLIFENYKVNKVEFKTNDIKQQKQVWNLKFNINNITEVNKERNKMKITLIINIFEGLEDAPFSMNVEISGFFELAGEDDITRYEANAIAIMYPYLRAIVSTYTASANVSPVILPAINVNAMLKRKKEEENKEEN
ncbi:MAG: protein-export chaperone SecB [Clostridia bacterium]